MTPPKKDRVGGDHPLQAFLGKVEVGPDRRQRDVDDRDVRTTMNCAATITASTSHFLRAAWSAAAGSARI
jgi:hypothetical protein